MGKGGAILSTKTHYCDGCGNEHPQTEMVNLEGYDTWWACKACWATMTPFQRISLSIMTRPSFEGGLCHGTELEAIEEALTHRQENQNRASRAAFLANKQRQEAKPC